MPVTSPMMLPPINVNVSSRVNDGVFWLLAHPHLDRAWPAVAPLVPTRMSGMLPPPQSSVATACTSPLSCVL
jgi:hypothetical protein